MGKTWTVRGQLVAIGLLRTIRSTARVTLIIAFVSCLLLISSSVATAAGKPPRADRWTKVRNAMANIPCKANEVNEKTTSVNLKTLSVKPSPEGVAIGEMDIFGQTLAAHIRHPFNGFRTFDLTQPPHLKIPLGTAVFEEDGRSAWDVKISRDGKTAIVGFADEAGLLAVWSAGLALFDITNPRAPRFLSEWVSPRPGVLQNAHMIYTQKIDGDHWVFVAANDSTGVWIFKMTGEPGSRSVEYVTQTLPVQGGPFGPHDVYVQFDQLLETWVLYVADGKTGWTAFDVSEPARPLLLGGLPHPSGYTHSVQAGIVNDRRIVVTTEEGDGLATGLSWLRVYDASNLKAPLLLGQWHAPSGPDDWQHNIQIVGDYLYLAHYDNGLYVFDLRTLTTHPPIGTEPTPVAHYVQEGSFWDVLLKDGLIYASNLKAGPIGGIHVVGFGCNEVGDRALTSTG